MKTPICDFVRAYASRQPMRLHMPGHKGEGPLGAEALDITEIPGADVLYAPAGIIAESEANAAALFGSARTVYSAEGSSLCIRAMLYLARLWAAERRKPPLVLAGRNAHKAFLSGAALLDLNVEWLFPEVSGAGVLSCPISARTLDERLAEYGSCAPIVYITSPDYLGNTADIGALSAVCRRHGALLLVDNAHGAYLKFLHPSRHPLDLGADLCCDSAHKTLPVLTGGAYLHLSRQAPHSLTDAADRAMSLFASTSPSYLILQSLDAANRYLSQNYVDSLRDTAARVSQLRSTLRSVGWDCAGDEPLKLTLRTKARGHTGAEVAAVLEQYDLHCEFADPDHIVFMFTPEVPVAAYHALLGALYGIPPKEALTEAPPFFCQPSRILSPRQAMLSPAENVPVETAPGRILAAPGVSCPPAVPILVCGERIDEDAVRAFRYYGIDRVTVVK